MSAGGRIIRSGRAGLALTVIAVFVTLSPCAHAASPAAEALFEEGRRLLEAGHTDEACVKLAESLAQEMSSGTLLNLALCHEMQGHIATAWAEYRASARLSRNQGRIDRAETADARALLLEPKLPRLTLTAERTVPGQNLSIDDNVIGVGALGLAVPIDPGEHRVTVSAPGHVSWTTTVTVEETEQRTLHMPALEAEASRPPSAQPSPVAAGGALPPPAPKAPRHAPGRDDEPSSTSLVPGLIVGGVGVVALGVGVGFGLSSLSTYDAADELCPSHLDCSDAAISERTSAESKAWVSTAAFAVGLVGVGVGAYLVLTSGSDTRYEKKVTLRAQPMANGGWLGATTTF